jgi:DNA-binding beta-propeller fold protein YncE/plastocyanin
MILTTVILSITLASVFTINFAETNVTTYKNTDIPLAAEAAHSGDHHTIEMEAVKMPDGMYAYRMVSYVLDGVDLVDTGVYDTDPSIPGPTIVMTEGDSADITLTNNACDENFVDGGVGAAENFFVGMHTHGVHYDISDDATYKRVNGAETSAAECGASVHYKWDAGLGTAGTWPYHDHTFSQNEVGAEDVGLFGTLIVNPASGVVNGLVNSGTGDIDYVDVDDIEKEFILWMVSSDVLGKSIFYGMEIDNQNGGKQTPLWVNPTLYATDGAKVRYHVLGIGDETHAFHLHGHRWVEAQGGSADIIDVKEITPLQRHTFLVEVSDNGNDIDGPEGWMYHCHVFAHMQQGMSGMMMVLPIPDGTPEEEIAQIDTIPDVGAVFTLSDEPGLWMKTLNAGIADDLDEALESLGVLDPGTARAGTGFPLDYLGTALSPAFADSQGRSLAVIHPGETVIFNMKDSQTKHTITSLIWPTAAEKLGGNGLLTNDVPVAFFDTQLGIRGSTFLTNTDGSVATLDTPGLYVFVCQIHPYMISAVIVDDPETNVKSSTLGGAILPLLDLSDDLTILTRYPDPVSGDVEFPVTLGPVNALPLELLKDFYVISDPSNWKDYTQDNWEVNLVPALVTTNTEDVVAVLNTDTDSLLGLATALGITKEDGTPYNLDPEAGPVDTILGADLDSKVAITNADKKAPNKKGVGEIWVNTQFEKTVNKNHPGTSNDKPGTITVVDAKDWSIDKKIALPEINMNHPHNMWTDSKNEVVYQTQWFDSRLVVIDRESGEMIKDNFVGQSPSHVMTSPETGTIYVAMNGEETINELDPTTYEITRQISTGEFSHPHGHWISSDGKYIVTPDFLSLSSTIVNLEDNTSVKAEHTAGGTTLIAPIATGMLGSTEKYYTADFLGNTLSVINTDDAEITHQIDLLEVGAGLPIQTPVSPDDKWMVTANLLGPHGAAITVVDTSVDEIVATLPCDPGCHGVQWGAKKDGGYYAYVSSKFSNALIVVDPKDGYNAEIAGKIILTKEFETETDDPIIGYAGLGGQGVLAIPNVYEGWIQHTVDECGNNADPCSDEIVKYLHQLKKSQKDPLGHPDNGEDDD